VLACMLVLLLCHMAHMGMRHAMHVKSVSGT
jgi:hypothetical protein